MTTLSGKQVADAGLDGWTNLGGVLVTRIGTRTFTAGVELVDTIGGLAESAGHHPDVDLRYGHVDVHLTTHDAGGLTDKDVDLAKQITAVVRANGMVLDGTMLSRTELALDTPDTAAVLPFWQTFLGYEKTADDALGDPAGSEPPLWFQASTADEPRQRWHLDVWVDPSQVKPRIDAALAAGGTVVDDSASPSFWVLADADGNRSCLCTWMDRG